MSKASDYVRKRQEATAARPKRLAMRSKDSTSSVVEFDLDDKGNMTVTMPAIVSGGQTLVFGSDISTELGNWLISTFSDGKKRKRKTTQRGKRETSKITTGSEQVPTNDAGGAQPGILRQPEDVSQSL